MTKEEEGVLDQWTDIAIEISKLKATNKSLESENAYLRGLVDRLTNRPINFAQPGTGVPTQYVYPLGPGTPFTVTSESEPKG